MTKCLQTLSKIQRRRMKQSFMKTQKWFLWLRYGTIQLLSSVSVINPIVLGSCFEPNLILFCVFSNGWGLNSRELTHQSHCSFTSLENQLRALSKTNKPHKLSNWVRNLPLEPSHCPLISDYFLFPYFTGISITVSIFDKGLC